MSRIVWIILVAFVLGLPETANPQFFGNSISGVVVDDASDPIAGALVFYNNIVGVRRLPGGRIVLAGPEVRSGTRTGAGGLFSITGIPPGTYHLCALGTEQRHLMSCSWGQVFRPVRLDLRTPLSGIRLVVRRGAVLNLRIEDPNQRLAKPSLYNIGVMSPAGYYARAIPVARIGSELHLAIGVPEGLTVRLFLGSRAQFTDAAGRPVVTNRVDLPIAIGAEDEVTVRLTAR